MGISKFQYAWYCLELPLSITTNSISQHLIHTLSNPNILPTNINHNRESYTPQHVIDTVTLKVAKLGTEPYAIFLPAPLFRNGTRTKARHRVSWQRGGFSRDLEHGKTARGHRGTACHAIRYIRGDLILKGVGGGALEWGSQGGGYHIP